MGSGGGGGTQGSVRWPTYFETWHGQLIDDAQTDELNSSMVAEMNTALGVGGNPFTDAVAYNPSTAITAMQANIDSWQTTLSAISPSTMWHDNMVVAKAAYDDHVFSTTKIAAAETAFNNILDAEYADSDLPRFQRGMQDLNAVMSSAYVTGKALMDAKIVLKKAQFSAELRLQSYKDETNFVAQSAGPVNQFYIGFNDLFHRVLTTQLEVRRYEIVAQKEATDQNLKIEEAEATWGMDVFLKGANVLAAGQGGVTHPTAKAASMLQSALGGAMSGAAAGIMAGAPWAAETGGLSLLIGGIAGTALGGGAGAASGK